MAAGCTRTKSFYILGANSYAITTFTCFFCVSTFANYIDFHLTSVLWAILFRFLICNPNLVHFSYRVYYCGKVQGV